MTMTRRRTTQENGRLLKATLATGSVLATLVGADLMASKSWLDEVADMPVDSAIVSDMLSPIPTIARPEAEIELRVPPDLPGKVAMPSLDLAPMPTVAVPQGMSVVSSGQSAVPLTTVKVPQVTVPQIPSAPVVPQTAVSVDLPPIPSVTIPQPVTSGKSS